MISDFYRKGVLKVLWSFYSRGVSDRLGEIFWRQETALAAIVAGSSVFWSLPHADLSGRVADLCVAYIGYAAIALGFCVGGITIALTLPDRAFMLKLANLNLEGRGDALSSLLFVFCWTAVVHWVSIIAFALILLFDGHNEVAVFASGSLHYRVLRALAIFLAGYALMQFLITVLTLWQAGSLYIQGLKTTQESAGNS
jgi:hypothetical protein